jgi:hypothetical protein
MKKKNNILYALLFLFLIFLFIYINKNLLLESYTYNRDLTFNGNPIPLKTFNNTQLSTCKLECNAISNCKGFTSNIFSDTDISGTNTRSGTCSLYDHPSNDTQHMLGTNFYIK